MGIITLHRLLSRRHLKLHVFHDGVSVDVFAPSNHYLLRLTGDQTMQGTYLGRLYNEHLHCVHMEEEETLHKPQEEELHSTWLATIYSYELSQSWTSSAWWIILHCCCRNLLLHCISLLWVRRTCRQTCCS